MNTELSLSKIARDKLSQVIAERTSGKPISRIFGNKEFFSMNFDINKFVLDPRPDIFIPFYWIGSVTGVIGAYYRMSSWILVLTAWFTIMNTIALWRLFV